MGEEFVHKTDDKGVVGQLFQGAANRATLRLRQRFGLLVQAVAKGPHFLHFAFAEQTGYQ